MPERIYRDPSAYAHVHVPQVIRCGDHQPPRRGAPGHWAGVGAGRRIAGDAPDSLARARRDGRLPAELPQRNSVRDGKPATTMPWPLGFVEQRDGEILHRDG